MVTRQQVDKKQRGIYDKRNNLNDLTGKEWLQMSKSVWISKRNVIDKDAFDHPAPFLFEDIKRLILTFTKKTIMLQTYSWVVEQPLLRLHSLRDME